MEAQKVHEYTVETGPNGMPIARLGKVHNLVTFILSGKEKLHYLDGKWVDDGKNPVPLEDVPQAYIDAISAIPFTPDRYSHDIMIPCEFCDESQPSKQYARHLVDKHIRAAGVADVLQAAKPAADEGRRFKPEDLPPGNYALDDEGFVVLNKDGSPRLRAGRPTKEQADAPAEE